MATLPLNTFEECLVSRLGEVLWGWNICSTCASAKVCDTKSCPSQRRGRLERYLQFYKTITSSYYEDHLPANRLFETHEDLYKVVLELKSKPDITRAEFHNAIADANHHQVKTPTDYFIASALAIKVLTMIDCSALYQSSDRLETGTFRLHWREDVPFSKYLQDLFPTEKHPILSSVDSDLSVEVRSELRATKLRKRLSLSFRATHDVRNHLKLDRRSNTLEIYHHSAFIKEQLRLTKGSCDSSTPFKSLKLGALPRQLLLEVLDSLQTTLFPLSDPKSKRLLQTLVQTESFDPDIQHFEFSSIRSTGEESVPYFFLADRLAELYNELLSPRPRGWLERQMERKSGARYMMMATLIGVIFAVLLGMASLAVSSYQAWIAYQAWQHPVAPPNS